MVIGLLVVAGIPTTIGVCEALSAQKKANNAAKEKAKFHLTAALSLDGGRAVECWIVLKEGRLWIDHPDHPVPGHKFTGYYFTYPSEEQHRGLVSTIADDPPMLNWIFANKDTHVLSHGGRQATLGHVIGPWYWTEDEQWLTLEGGENDFIAVETDKGNWGIVWDRDRTIRGGVRGGVRKHHSDVGGEGGVAAGGNDSDEDEDEDQGNALDTERETVDLSQNGQREGCGSRNAVKWVPVRLHRKLQLGMESKYVKGEGGR